MTSSEMPDVRVGQEWEDGDPRQEGRRIRVIEVHPNGLGKITEAFAVVELVKPSYNVSQRAIGRRTRIAMRRFRPRSNGYELVYDVLPADGDPGALEED